MEYSLTTMESYTFDLKTKMDESVRMLEELLIRMLGNARRYESNRKNKTNNAYPLKAK